MVHQPLHLRPCSLRKSYDRCSFVERDAAVGVRDLSNAPIGSDDDDCITLEDILATVRALPRETCRSLHFWLDGILEPPSGASLPETSVATYPGTAIHRA